MLMSVVTLFMTLTLSPRGLTWALFSGCFMLTSILLSSCHYYAFTDCPLVISCLLILTWLILVMMIISAPPSFTLLASFIILIFIVALAFISNSLIYFYFWFEASLIPMAFILLGWGLQPERLSATLYMLFYTLISATPFLVIVLTRGGGLFNSLSSYAYAPGHISLLLALPFLVKTPMFLFHLWLPKAHVEAPVYGSMFLAAILLKLGGVGLMRLSPILSPSCWLLLGVCSVVGGGVACLYTMSQVDIKGLIAYSSIVHMAITTFCLLSASSFILQGLWLMLIGHGLCSSGLFYGATVLYSRLNTRSLIILKGLLKSLPSLALTWLILVMMNISAPPSFTLLAEALMITECSLKSLSLTLWPAWLILGVLFYSLQLWCSSLHGDPFNSYAYAPESFKELLILSFHAQWWVVGPFMLYLLLYA